MAAGQVVDVALQADEARAQAQAIAIGAAAAAAYDGWIASLPDDIGPAEALGQPDDITPFDAATFPWRGGSNAVDNPTVRVERRVGQQWRPFADQSGEVQTMVHFPAGMEGVVDTYSGSNEWTWTANCERTAPFPLGLGRRPPAPTASWWTDTSRTATCRPTSSRRSRSRSGPGTA